MEIYLYVLITIFYMLANLGVNITKVQVRYVEGRILLLTDLSVKV